MIETTLPEPATINRDARISESILRDRFRWIAEFVELNGWPPSYREMGDGWGVSHAAVKHSLNLMEEDGWLQQGEGARQIKINKLQATLVRTGGNGNAGSE